MPKILITGGSGMIGQHLIPKLLSKGYEINVLSRSKKDLDGCEVFVWDVDKGYVEDGALEGVDHIVHLAGYNVSEGRWTQKRRNLIYNSRIKSLRLLIDLIEGRSIKSVISASGSSIYGTITSDKIFQEEDALSEAKDDFLADVSIHWENTANLAKSVAERVVILRTPVVLGHEGALPKLSKPIKMGIGSALGNGKQWVPWVHLDDIANAYLFAIEKESMKGPYNVAANDHVTNLDLTKKVAEVLDKKLWAPKVPAFLLKLLFGKMANIILKGSRLDNSKIQQTGFEFRFQHIEPALKHLLNKS